jgi:hypothetical protein
MHNYTRYDLYNVSTESFLRTRLEIVVIGFWSFLPWVKKRWEVREYAMYECVGQHRQYMGWFSFLEEELTDWFKSFETEEAAIKYKLENM